MSKTTSEVKNWLNSKVGQGLDYDGAYGNQCVDLANFYCDFIGAPKIPCGYAYQMWNNFDPNSYTKIANHRELVARAGDIVIWDIAINGYAGHVAIATGEGNIDWFESLDQNWNSSVCTKVRHNWNLVLGVLRPKTVTDNAPADPKTRTLAFDQVAFRTEASTAGGEATVKQRWDTGDWIEQKGYVHGQALNINGYNSDIWFVSKLSGLYSWSGFYTDKSTNSLPNLTPATPAPTPEPAPEPTPEPAKEGIEMIDVSAFQGETIDFVKVKADKVAGVILRSGHVGKSYGGLQPHNVDPNHDRWAKEAREAGLLVGHYWYCFQALDPVEEANAFMSTDIKDGEPLFIDAEERDLAEDWVNKFADAIKDKVGATAIYYDYTANLKAKTWVSGANWQADYTGTAGKYSKVRDLVVLMHQYTSSGSVKGVSGNVDRNIYFGKSEDWVKLGKWATPEGTEPRPEPLPYDPPTPPQEQPFHGLSPEEFKKLMKEGELKMVDGWKPQIPDIIRKIVYYASIIVPAITIMVTTLLAVYGVMDANLAIQTSAVISAFFATIAGALGVAHFTRSKAPYEE